MKVLALVPNLLGHAPGQRTNIEAWAPYLSTHGIDVVFYPFETQSLHGTLYSRGGTAKKVKLLGAAYMSYLADLPSPKEFDVLYVYREAALVGPALTERWMAWKHIPYVYAIDDPIFVPYRSPFQGSFSWLKFFKKAARTCARSSATIVNSYPLKAWARQHCDDVTRIPSVVDIDRYAQARQSVEASLVVGWSGSQTTRANLVTIESQLKEVRDARGVSLRAIGIEPGGSDLREFECRPWKEETEATDIKAFDIGLAPMVDNAWNHWKFSLKVAQYGAAGVPVVASPVGDIPNQVVSGKTGFMAETHEDWVNGILQLLDNAELRQQMGNAAAALARSLYSAEVTAEVACEVLRRAVDTR